MNISPNENPDDIWTRIKDVEQEPEPIEDPTSYAPSAGTIAVLIIGVLGFFGFACYGLYRLVCAALNLVP